jgi:MoaA/NifB/PqqE/SkfB family radical SAM enzyme
VVENIRALKAENVQIRINLSITPYNRHDLKRIYDVAEELGVPLKAASYMYPPVRVNAEQYGSGNRLNPEEAADSGVQWDLLRFTDEEFALRAQNMKNFISRDVPECMAEQEEGVTCRAGSSAFWITWDGRMLPCGMMPYPEVDLLEMGFHDAWQQIRQKTREIHMPGQCGACPKKDVCSVCPAVCVTETGKFDQVPKYVCQMTDATIQKTWGAYQERTGDNYGDKKRTCYARSGRRHDPGSCG